MSPFSCTFVHVPMQDTSFMRIVTGSPHTPVCPPCGSGWLGLFAHAGSNVLQWMALPECVLWCGGRVLPVCLVEAPICLHPRSKRALPLTYTISSDCLHTLLTVSPVLLGAYCVPPYFFTHCMYYLVVDLYSHLYDLKCVRLCFIGKISRVGE